MKQLILKIGRRHRLEVASLLEAQQVYCALRDQSREGASTWPSGTVGSQYVISYNGRVWKSAHRFKSGSEAIEINPATGEVIPQVPIRPIGY